MQQYLNKIIDTSLDHKMKMLLLKIFPWHFALQKLDILHRGTSRGSALLSVALEDTDWLDGDELPVGDARVGVHGAVG